MIEINIKPPKVGIISFILFLCFFQQLSGQSSIWTVGYNGFFDNREYFNPYVQPQTMFGSHVFGHGGFNLTEFHSLQAGLDVLYEFGGELSKESFSPIIYFQFEKDFIDLRLGAFPRKNIVEMPKVLQNDTIFYYRPNLQGIYLKMEQSWGYHNVWLDWTSRQTDLTRETFQIGGTGRLNQNIFFYQHDFIMTHYAGPAVPIPGDNIRDNGGLTAKIGLNFGNSLFDSISISTGYCFSYDRVRNEYDLRFLHGSISMLYLELYNIGLRTTHYFGDGQVQMWGDGFYAAPYYHRLDLAWNIFRRENITGKIEFSFHIVKDVFDMSQAFTIFATLDGERKMKRND